MDDARLKKIKVRLEANDTGGVMELAILQAHAPADIRDLLDDNDALRAKLSEAERQITKERNEYLDCRKALYRDQAELLRANERNAKLAEAERERDEADRRAGAAERRMEDLTDTRAKNASWIRKAKDQWGVIDNISFDVVWDEALKARDALTAANERNAKLVEVIRNIQWGIGACIVCGRAPHHKDGHNPACSVGQALAALDAKEQDNANP